VTSWAARSTEQQPVLQDNPVSWVDWTTTDDPADLLSLTRRLLALRRSHPVFRRRAFFAGRSTNGTGRQGHRRFRPVRRGAGRSRLGSLSDVPHARRLA
jgi:pullulanase/glycogen debranching enzyme